MAMTSPGSSVNAREQKATIRATLKIISDVLESWTATPLQDRPDGEPLRIGDLVGGDDDRTHRAEGVERLGTHELLVRLLEVARAHVVDAGVAEDVRERLRLGHAAGRCGR